MAVYLIESINSGTLNSYFKNKFSQFEDDYDHFMPDHSKGLEYFDDEWVYSISTAESMDPFDPNYIEVDKMTVSVFDGDEEQKDGINHFVKYFNSKDSRGLADAVKYLKSLNINFGNKIKKPVFIDTAEWVSFIDKDNNLVEINLDPVGFSKYCTKRGFPYDYYQSFEIKHPKFGEKSISVAVIDDGVGDITTDVIVRTPDDPVPKYIKWANQNKDKIYKILLKKSIKFKQWL